MSVLSTTRAKQGEELSQTEKDRLREELARQTAQFEQESGGEVVKYAAVPPPERRPWKKRKNLLDQAFEAEIEKAEKERQKASE